MFECWTMAQLMLQHFWICFEFWVVGASYYLCENVYCDFTCMHFTNILFFPTCLTPEKCKSIQELGLVLVNHLHLYSHELQWFLHIFACNLFSSILFNYRVLMQHMSLCRWWQTDRQTDSGSIQYIWGVFFAVFLGIIHVKFFLFFVFWSECSLRHTRITKVNTASFSKCILLIKAYSEHQ